MLARVLAVGLILSNAACSPTQFAPADYGSGYRKPDVRLAWHAVRRHSASAPYVYVTQSSALPTGLQSVKASCPTGYEIAGGGFVDGSTLIQSNLYGSYYGSGHKAWVTYVDDAYNAPSISASAVCAPGSGSGTLVYVSNTENLSGYGDFHVSATCPSGYKVIGGGFQKSTLGNYFFLSVVGSHYGSTHDRWWTDYWISSVHPAYNWAIQQLRCVRRRLRRIDVYLG